MPTYYSGLNTQFQHQVEGGRLAVLLYMAGVPTWYTSPGGVTADSGCCLFKAKKKRARAAPKEGCAACTQAGLHSLRRAAVERDAGTSGAGTFQRTLMT
jgi:hypothetical protein